MKLTINLLHYEKSLTWIEFELLGFVFNDEWRSLIKYHSQGNHKEIDLLWFHVK